MDVNSRPLRGLVFDKDGTLFDFNATWGAWARQVFTAETRGDPRRLAALANAMGYDLHTGLFQPTSVVIASTARDIAQAALPHIAETSIDALMTRWNAAAVTAPQVEVTPLVPFLADLKAKGYVLGLATNDGETPARAHLAAANILPFWDFIAGSDSGFGGKPAPGQLQQFCALTGLAPAACAMIGDSTHDLAAGRAAGMACIAVLSGVATRADLAPHADIVLDSIADLPAWLARAGAPLI